MFPGNNSNKWLSNLVGEYNVIRIENLIVLKTAYAEFMMLTQ